MKRKKIDFIALTSGGYWADTEFEVLNWLLKTGQSCDVKTGRWTRAGVDQLLYGYSANNYQSYTDITSDFSRTLELAFFRALYKKHGNAVEAWRDREGIRPGKYRMLAFPDDTPEKPSYDHHSYSVHGEVWCLFDHVGGKLHKKDFHPDYPKRLDPFIKSMQLSTAGNGYRVNMEFTFKKCEDSGWSHCIYQAKDESFERFIWRANTEIFKLRLPYEKDSHRKW